MNEPLILQPATVEDIESLLQIETASFGQPWDRRAILDELRARETIQIIARQGDSRPSDAPVIGFLLARLLCDEMHLMKIAVAPGWRNRGTATMMLAAAQEEARRRGAVTTLLEVRPTNLAAIGFYRKTGFQCIGIRPNYYPITGEDALVMSKRFKEEP